MNNKKKLFYTVEELMERKITEVPMLWKPFFPQSGLAGLTGSSDTGKSTLLRQLCIAVCFGKREFLGSPLKPKYRSAIYISTEDCEDAISASIRKQLNNLRTEDVAGLKFIFNQDDPIATACEILSSEKADVLIIDAWADLFSGNINDITQTRKELNKLKMIAATHGCLVIILHHTVKNSEYSKPDKNKLNGSQGIEASLRSLLELRPGTGTERILSILKGNYIPTKIKNSSLVLDFNEDHLLFRSTGETIDKKSLSDSARGTFSRDTHLCDKIIHLRDKEMLSFPKILEAIKKENPNLDPPSLSMVKKMYSTTKQRVA